MPFKKDNKLRYKHGCSHSSDRATKLLYQVWIGMKQRCYNPKNIGYTRYGALGIIVCTQWLHSFKTFAKWALSNGYEIGLQIDRRKNNSAYTPRNCRFVTAKVNSNNRKDNHMLTYNGEQHTLSEWAYIFKISSKVLFTRINKHKWNTERALTQKVRKSPIR
jgi:hypothetical protein